MEITLHRSHQEKDATIGLIYLDDNFAGMTLEDVHREVKVNGKTRIPAGEYQIKERKVLSPLTRKYREKYPWFTWHLEIQDVPSFSNVYLHVGNSAKDTDGCILVGSSYAYGSGFIGNSLARFERVYQEITSALHSGEDVYITIRGR